MVLALLDIDRSLLGSGPGERLQLRSSLDGISA
jgi:hypothetical protein